MTVPTIRVEVAFGLGAYSEPTGGQWVDVTADVFEINTQRGRNSEFDQFPAGTCTVGLYNDSRQYDPLNTAGTYYGDLVANVPIRVVATISAVDYHLWRGYVDGWPARYTDAGYRSEVHVRCTDAFKLLAERRMPDTHLVFFETYAPGTPDMWYRCDSLSDGVLSNSGTIGRDGTQTVPMAIGEPLLPVSDASLAVPAQWSPSASTYTWGVACPVVSTGDDITASTTWTVALAVREVSRGFRGLYEIVHPSDINNPPVIFCINSISVDYNYPFFWIETAGNTLSGTSTVDVGDGAAHVLVLVRDGTTATLYVDGGVGATDTDGAAGAAVDNSGGFAMIGRTPLGLAQQGPAVAIDEIMGWNTALTAAQVATLTTQLTTGLATYLTGAAITEILDIIGWPATLRSIDGGETFVTLPVDFNGSVLDILQNIAACEGGRLFVDTQGRVTFHERGRFISETAENTVQYTFSAQTRDTAPTGVGLLDGTLSITVDDRLSFDAATVTRNGGIAQTATATATPARTYSATGLLFPADLDALALANWVVFRYGTPLPRSEEWDIDPETMPDDWDNILTLDIGHRIKHDITPGGIGSSINLEQHLSLISHDINPDRWTITMNGTPTDPNGAVYFLWATTVTADDDNGWADTDGTPPGGYWG